MASHVAPKSILKRRDETANTTDDDYQQRMINRQSVSWKDIVETESESTYLENPPSHQQRPRKHKATHRSSSSWRKAIEASLYGDGAQQGEALPLTSNVTPNNKNPQSPSEKGSISTTCKPRSAVCQPASDNRELASDSFARRRMPRHQDENNDHQQQSKPNRTPAHDINTHHVNRNSKISKKIDPRSRAESTERVRSIPVVHKPIRRRTSVTMMTTTTRDLHDADDDEGQEGLSFGSGDDEETSFRSQRDDHVQQRENNGNFSQKNNKCSPEFSDMTSRQPSSRIMMHKHQQEMQETYPSTSGNNKPFQRLGNTSSFCSLEASERNECWPKPFEAKYASGTDSFSDEESTAPKKQHLPYDNPIKTSLHETISSKTGEKFIHDPIISDFEETEQHSFQERRGRNVKPQRPKKLDVQLRRERSPDMLKPYRKSVTPKPSSTKLSQTFNKEDPSERFEREFHDNSYPTSGRDEAPHFPEKPNRKSPPEKFARKSIQGSEDSGFNRNQEYRDADSLLEYASTQKKSRLERSRVTATVSSHNQSTTINSAENDASEVPLPQRLKQILNPDPTLNPFRPKLNPQTSVTRDTNNKGIRGLHSKTSMESNPYRDSDTGLAEEHKEDPCLLSKASMKFKRNAFVNEVDIDSYAKFDDEDDRELISSGCQSPPSAQILNIGRHMIKRPRPSAMNIPKTSRGDSAARQRVLDRSEPSTKSFDVSFCQHLLVANEPLPEDDEMSTKTDTVSTSKSVEIGEENYKPVANIRTKVATCRTTSRPGSTSAPVVGSWRKFVREFPTREQQVTKCNESQNPIREPGIQGHMTETRGVERGKTDGESHHESTTPTSSSSRLVNETAAGASKSSKIKSTPDVDTGGKKRQPEGKVGLLSLAAVLKSGKKGRRAVDSDDDDDDAATTDDDDDEDSRFLPRFGSSGNDFGRGQTCGRLGCSMARENSWNSFNPVVFLCGIFAILPPQPELTA